MSDSQRTRISMYLDLAKYPELEYLQRMGAGRSAEALRLMAIGKRHEDHVVKQMAERLGGFTNPEALREIMFNPLSQLNKELDSAIGNESLAASKEAKDVEETKGLQGVDSVTQPVKTSLKKEASKKIDNDDDAGDGSGLVNSFVL